MDPDMIKSEAISEEDQMEYQSDAGPEHEQMDIQPDMPGDYEQEQVALKSETTQGHKLVMIHPRGDLDLVCGDKRLRVGVEILALHSEVFTAMTSSTDAEGQQIFSSASPGVIELSEDNPTDLQTLCEILHMKSPQSLQKLDSEDLVRVCILGDKYGVTSAIKPTMMYRAQQLSETRLSCSGDIELLTASFLVEDQEFFQKQSGKLVLNHLGDFNKHVSKLVAHNLPSDILWMLLAQRNKSRTTVLEGMIRPVALLSAPALENWYNMSGGSHKHDGKGRDVAIAQLVKLTEDWRLHQKTLAQILASLHEFIRSHEDIKFNHGSTYSALTKVATVLENNVGGLCVRCYLKKRLSALNCTREHSKRSH